jgi:hypothetical protein
VIAKASTTCT